MIAAYTGTFDPITLGHADMISRASRLFEKVIVAVAVSSAKKPFFELDLRVQMAQESLAHLPNVEVQGFSGLMVDFARANNIRVLVRGVRNVTDFDYESQMARMIKHLDADLDTVILPPTAHLAHISSTLVREIASLNGDVSGLVPEPVLQAVLRRRQGG
ncbi:MAG: pantetheine-phosphate adenylyltransferase [Oceanococcaceae bacterium]